MQGKDSVGVISYMSGKLKITKVLGMFWVEDVMHLIVSRKHKQAVTKCSKTQPNTLFLADGFDCCQQ